MERIKQAYIEQLGPVRLYRDDIEKVYGTLAEVCEKATIKAEGYSYSEIEKLFELKKEVLHDIKFRCDTPSINIDLKPNRAYLYAWEDDALSRGILASVKDVIPFLRAQHLGNILSFFSSALVVIIVASTFYFSPPKTVHAILTGFLILPLLLQL